MTSPARDADIDGLLWSFARDCVDKGTQFSDPSTTYERDLARTACSAERLRSLLDARNATPAAPALEGARDATGVLRTEEAPSERPDETLGLAQAIREMHTVAEESPAAFDCCAMCHEEWPCNAVSLAWAILDRAASSSSVREAPSEPSALQRDASGEIPDAYLLDGEIDGRPIRRYATTLKEAQDWADAGFECGAKRYDIVPLFRATRPAGNEGERRG